MGRRYVRFGLVRNGLLGDPRYANSRRGSGGDEPTAPAASSIAFGRVWMLPVIPQANGGTVVSSGDKRHLLGLYAGAVD